MDTPFSPSGHNQRGMDYPSTTQALFALIVMIIVLLFILVYCCWGTMTCGRPPDQVTPSTEDLQANNTNQAAQDVGNNQRAVVIFPFNSMIYVGDGEHRRIYHIPSNEEKPPPYTELYTQLSAPPTYLNSIHSSDVDSPPNLHEMPPSYDDYLTAVRKSSSKPTVIIAPTTESPPSTTPITISDNVTEISTNTLTHQTADSKRNPIPANISIVLKGSMNKVRIKTDTGEYPEHVKIQNSDDDKTAESQKRIVDTDSSSSAQVKESSNISIKPDYSLPLYDNADEANTFNQSNGSSMSFVENQHILPNSYQRLPDITNSIEEVVSHPRTNNGEECINEREEQTGCISNDDEGLRRPETEEEEAKSVIPKYEKDST